MDNNSRARISTWVILAGRCLGASLAVCGSPLISQASSSTNNSSQVTAYDPASAQVAMDVLKLVRAKVEPNVIVAYVQNNRTPLNFTSGQIIALKKAGVPDDVLKALLERVAQPATKRPVQQTPARHQTQAAPYAPAAQGNAPYGSGWLGYPGYSSGYQPGWFSPYSSLIAWPSGTFNNSYPTYINGYPVYTGSYASLLGLGFGGSIVSFNNSYPTYVGGYPVYSGYFVSGLGGYW
jgi:hypothetical protein